MIDINPLLDGSLLSLVLDVHLTPSCSTTA